MYIKNDCYLVFGVSKSGYSIAEYIIKNGGKCYIYEEVENEQVFGAIKELESIGGIKVDLEFIKNNIDIFDSLILSPGVPINHSLAVYFKENGKHITGEFEFSYNQTMPTFIGVTGTNGKTTTVSLIDAILKESEIKSALVGNVGIPLSSKIDKIDRDSVVVSEISSFQLETTRHFSPHIACILNITPDHLERHYTMENYIFVKRKIIKNMQENDYLILNYDDETCRAIAEETKAKVIFISVKENVNGGYINDGSFCFKNENVMPIKNCALMGEHNEYNTLFSIAVCKILGVENEKIVKGLSAFKGVKHRIELVCQKNGVDYYNDSKATNTASTMVAMKSIQKPMILILGGSEKGEDYKKLFEEIKYYGIKQVVLTGASRFNMIKCANEINYSNISIIPDFEYAVKTAIMYAESGDAVLLSPACASFDSFKNYEERGNKFVELIKENGK